MSDLSMLINGLKVTAEKNATFERRNPLDGTVATRAPAASPGRCGDGGGGRGRGLQDLERDRPRRAPHAAAEGRRRSWRPRLPQFVEAVAAETGATGMWAGFNVMLAAGMIREAASLTTQISRRGDPVRRARLAGDGHAPAGRRGAGHRAVERADHPGRARHRHAAGLRQHRDPQGQRELPAHAPADRRGLPGGGLPARRRQLHHQRAGRCGRGGGGDGGAPGGAARQLHRLARGRPHHRADLRQVPEAGGAGARRQGAAGDPGRCRHRRRGQRRGLRLLRQQRADLHEHRAHHRRPEDGRRVRRRKFADQGQSAAAGRPAQARAGGAGQRDRHGHGGALQRADRRRAGQGRQAAVRRQGRQHADAGHACWTT